MYVQRNERVKVRHIAKIIGERQTAEKLGELELLQVTPEDNNIIIVDQIHLVEKIQQYDKSLEIQILGPGQTIIEVELGRKKASFLLFAAVWLLLFVGAAMTIMNFHVDVSMAEVHQKLFRLITGKEDTKPLLIQIPYSFGLGIGMILFFNHFFKKRFNEEPSPLEVEMFNYQQDLDQYVIMHENKESVQKQDDR